LRDGWGRIFAADQFVRILIVVNLNNKSLDTHKNLKKREEKKNNKQTTLCAVQKVK